MAETIFEKIIKREIPADIVYEDELCVAFRDAAPQAPVHILIVPKDPIEKVADARTGHEAILGHLLVKAGEIARSLNCADAFRLVINNGEKACQTVFHLHVHLLAGRRFSWPPG